MGLSFYLLHSQAINGRSCFGIGCNNVCWQSLVTGNLNAIFWRSCSSIKSAVMGLTAMIKDETPWRKNTGWQLLWDLFSAAFINVNTTNLSNKIKTGLCALLVIDSCNNNGFWFQVSISKLYEAGLGKGFYWQFQKIQKENPHKSHLNSSNKLMHQTQEMKFPIFLT